MNGTFLISGVIFGLSAGLTPGPILTLVIFQTLAHGIKEGVKVALAPLLTDVPIVIVSLLVLARMSHMKTVMGLLSIFGGIYLFYLAYESIRFKGADLNKTTAKPQSIRKGVMANFLNPNPYMFWISIGGPLVLKASHVHFTASLMFIVPFYALLVGSKCMVAVIFGNSRELLKSNHYIFTIRALGCLLVVFGILFFRDGLKYFGVH
jgi:threonine/homoserine/homoserine lactone efflux protein